MKKTFPITFLITVTLLTSCHKNSDKPGAPPAITPIETGPHLYIGGGISSAQGVYWKTPLSHSAWITDTLKNAPIVTSLLSASDGLYVAAQNAGYYKNDSFVAVNSAGRVEYLAKSGNTVYAAGFDNRNDAAYWAGNSEVDLSATFDRSRFPYEGASTFMVSAIDVSSGNVYVTGSLSFQNEPYAPDTAISGNFALFWTNGSLQPYGSGVLLSTQYQATTGLAVSGNDIYIAGQYPSKNYNGGYWKNGVFSNIDSGNFIPATVAAANGNIYIPGTIYTHTSGSVSVRAACWINGNLIPLDGGYALAITFYQSDVYILGIDSHSNVVVWKNGALFTTLAPSAAIIATSIAIR